MLSKPFRGMPRTRLLTLLIVFVGLEIAGALGLYATSRPATAASVTDPGTQITPAPGASSLAQVQCSVAAPVVGKPVTFSARMKDLAGVVVTYQVRYPDGSIRNVYAKSDAAGRSTVKFTVNKHASGPHAAIGVGVYYNGQKRAFAQFPVSAK